MDYSRFTVAQLKDELRQLSLPVSGNKDQLVDRLSRGRAKAAAEGLPLPALLSTPKDKKRKKRKDDDEPSDESDDEPSVNFVSMYPSADRQIVIEAHDVPVPHPKEAIKAPGIDRKARRLASVKPPLELYVKRISAAMERDTGDAYLKSLCKASMKKIHYHPELKVAAADRALVAQCDCAAGARHPGHLCSHAGALLYVTHSLRTGEPVKGVWDKQAAAMFAKLSGKTVFQ